MSNSAAYAWSYVDIEAEERRELRAELAQETSRSRHLRGQAKSLRRVHRTARIDVPVVTVSSQADSTELAEALASARRINEHAEAELGRAAAAIWSTPAAEADDTDSRPAARPVTHTAARTAQAAQAAREERTARVRAAAVVEAEALLNRDGPSCEPSDLPELARRLEALRRARTAEEARTLLADLGVLAHRSALRQRAAARTEALRTRLLDRLEDADPQDRERLVAAVTEAPDPAHLEGEVEHAVARADTEKYRTTVADTLMQVLRERDYAVGDDFADLLAEDGSIVVPFGAAADTAGYGLRVTLAPDRPGLTTALVRAPEAEGEDADTDSRVQHWFCDEQLPGIEDAVRDQGVDLDRTSALPPGVLRTAVAPDGTWPDRARTHDDETTDRTPGRPRRKRRTAARDTSYRQERGRER